MKFFSSGLMKFIHRMFSQISYLNFHLLELVHGGSVLAGLGPGARVLGVLVRLDKQMLLKIKIL